MVFSAGAAFFPEKFKEEFEKTAKGVANNTPEVLSYIDTHSEEASLSVNGFGDLLEVAVNKRLFSQWLNPWAAKQTCAMWSEQTGKPITTEQRILIRWLPNPFDVDSKFIALVEESFHGRYWLKQGKETFEDQFFYRFAISDDKEYGAFFVIIHDVLAIFCIVAESHYFANRHEINYGELFATGPRTGISRVFPEI